MSLNITRHDPAYDALWDRLVARSMGGTVMHSRRFLNYHDDRFADESLCIWRDPGVRLKAVLPLARSLQDASVVVSHPGSTFGGLLEDGIDPPERAAILAQVARLLIDRGYRSMIYKPAPAILGGRYDESDLRLMMRAGTVRRTDLWNLIRLDQPHDPSPKRRASIRAAQRKGVLVRRAETDADWTGFHAMLSEGLSARYGAAPAHSIGEMLSLKERLSGDNALWLAVDADDTMLAGTWCLTYNRQSIHTQYIASTAQGRERGAVDLLLSQRIHAAAEAGYGVFSFGINTRADGFSVNSSLLQHKLRFGSGVAVHWQFDVDLEQLAQIDAGFA